MLPNETLSYIQGLLHMATAAAEGAGPSGIECEFFPAEGFAEDFAACYELAPGRIRLVPEQESLDGLLTLWLAGWDGPRERDRRIARELAWLLRRTLGLPRALYRLDDEEAILADMSGRDGLGPFFFLEGCFLAAYETGLLCFFLGNDE